MMPIHWILAFLISCLLSLLLTPLLRQFVLNRSFDKGQIPRFGGTVIYFSFMLPLLVFSMPYSNARMDRSFAIGLVGSLLVLLIGVYDDLKGASVRIRLAVEITAACLVYFSGIGIHTLPNPFAAPVQLGWLGLPATVIWIVLITNAVNLIDGLDGLAAGSAVMILVTVLLLNWGRMPGAYLLAVLALLGALAGFLPYNLPPASIYMGDSGSLFLGFFLSVLSLATAQQAGRARLLVITALAFSLPLIDMAYAVARRWYRGVPIYRADQDHLHHKLLQKGFSRKKVLLLFYAANAILLSMLVAFFKLAVGRFFILLMLLAASAALFGGFQFLSELKPTDFLKKVLLLFRGFRIRRYHLYLINCFEREVEKLDALQQIEPHLRSLFDGCFYRRLKVVAKDGGTGEVIFSFGQDLGEMDDVHIEFPLIADGKKIGNVWVDKAVGRGGIFCIEELAQTLARTILRITAGKSPHDNHRE